ncbi:type III toxin-antitoxin system ToxN/AbiQ family toxin [Pectobacterium zantedeschiae]|uniref:Type III toxin-antitoxin system ToxN/AbiQ family toxin n=1 Tax=Pectobacterium aquaticum TaxID=2204145 RepID=A0AA93ANQ6_9GAMM|nr:type III toxin-antitoxin system ToxN/AbiQ family toxin [Pectobacterium zantedeschiae]RRO22892.1 type III toxin-antitoxin system ToxN/AbiQ family toxin [Pectobacterium aquaticum]RYC37162.1 type III toxin-antitoxin system ToxN/AbiQ family toxin [Pectobacterium zantedeschiae]TAJ02560.1 type III toxin-antitoxin system ToxN/AbiQ family toxin [Pectobacterium versatile]
MKFYVIADSYINHLVACDQHVYKNKGTRPYFGVVLEVNGVEFLAPLTSYKEKQDKIPNSSPLIFKMYELGNEENKLGMVQINNMVPVLSSEVEILDLSVLDTKYQNLLNLQQQFLRKNQEELQKKASKLYKIVSKGFATGIINMCCDFQALETAMKTYVPSIAQESAVPTVAQESSSEPQSDFQDKLSALCSKYSKK